MTRWLQLAKDRVLLVASVATLGAVAAIGLSAVGSDESFDAVASSAEMDAELVVMFDRERLPKSQIGSAVRQQSSLAGSVNEGVEEARIVAYAATQVVLGESLYRLGRAIGPEVTEEEVTAVLEDTDAVTPVEAVAKEPSEQSGEPGSAFVDDEVVRDTARRGLYKSRGLASLLGDRSPAEAGVREDVRDWFRQALSDNKVEITTPYGVLDHSTVVALMESDAASPSTVSLSYAQSGADD